MTLHDTHTQTMAAADDGNTQTNTHTKTNTQTHTTTPISITDIEKFIIGDTFHKLQIDNAIELFNSFSREKPFATLVAPMQSGKTTTFLLNSYLMLLYHRIHNVIIICGSNDNKLHTQLKNDFHRSFSLFINLVPCAREIFKYTKPSLHIYKSSHLKYISIPKHSLVIWDESHFAMDKHNAPLTMFERNNLPITPNLENATKWNYHHSFFLSVSATPFYEFAYFKASNTTVKSFIFMKPDEKYRGVDFLFRNQLVHLSKPISIYPQTLEHILQKFKHFDNTTNMFDFSKVFPSYAIIRTRRTNIAVQAAIHNGWKPIILNSKFPHSLGPLGIDSLKHKPYHNILVIISGMCRMGKVVPKQFISFVYEDSIFIKSDTCLQSLIGRISGYHKYFIHAFIPNFSLKRIACYPTFIRHGTLSHFSHIPTFSNHFLSFHSFKHNISL